MKPLVIVDIGNTAMKWGKVLHDRVMHTATLPLNAPHVWTDQLRIWGVNPAGQPGPNPPFGGAGRQGFAVVSVNPPVTEQFRVWTHYNRSPMTVLDTRSHFPVTLGVDEPDQVGLDRVANACEAVARADGYPVVVASVGTAVVIDAIDIDGVFRGGVILPGPRLMAQSLHTFTAQLPDLGITAVPPDEAPGTCTAGAISAGIRSAVLGAVLLLVGRYGRQFQARPKLILTGGGLGDLGRRKWGKRVAEVEWVPELTLEGVRRAADLRS